MACKVYIFHNGDDFSKTAVDRPICGLCGPASRISCRRFVKENKNLKPALRLLPVLLAATALSATAAAAASIGVVAPQSGPFALLGKQMQDGAEAAAERLGIEVHPVAETCQPGSGEAIGRELRDAKVTAAIGFLCSESLDGALPLLKEAGIPTITLSVRWKVLMEDALKNEWPFFRMAPTADDEAEKVIEIILREWSGDAVALIEDGTIHGRELVEAVRAGMEERGMKPVFTDTYRPGQEQQVALVRRLKKAGATHVFVGGDRNDVAIIARDAAAEKATLTLMGGDAMRAADQPVALAAGTLAVALPEYDAFPSAQEAVAILRGKGIVPEGYVLPAFAGVELAADAAGLSSAMGMPVAEALVGTGFETAIGNVTFDSGHELADNPYVLMEWRAGRFVPVGAVGQ